MTDNNQNSREQFYQHISGQNLTPLWESLHHLVPKTPNANCAPAYWNYQEIRPLLLESGSLIGAKRRCAACWYWKTRRCEGSLPSPRLYMPVCN